MRVVSELLVALIKVEHGKILGRFDHLIGRQRATSHFSISLSLNFLTHKIDRNLYVVASLWAGKMNQELRSCFITAIIAMA